MSTRGRVAQVLSAGVGLLLAACQPAALAPTTAPLVPSDTPAAVVQVADTAIPSATNTAIPDPTTAVPSSVPTLAPPTATVTASPTVAPTDTPTAVPPTATASPTARPTARPTVQLVPTNPPATEPPVVTAPLYSTGSGGPHGYTSTLVCTQPGGVPCQSTMAPGDKAFSIVLAAAEDAVPAIFVPFGLAVEKDGANVADMYMTVDSGWLYPGDAARMGTSRNFSQPGHYVIRTNGCYVTKETLPNCVWGIVDGTVVTFDIQ